ncbi:DUF6221 family protein [Nocardia salmonicida]|uniref:DUF6221 family protein n=1 Tax=Nocardia salmonicida TaxID=53431 RepID=UPI00362B8D30
MGEWKPGGDIAEFIAARLDEDEQIAQAAGPGKRAQWTYRGEHDNETGGEVYALDVADYVTMDSEGLTPAVEPNDGHHIARHDPARTLRQVERDRKVLARHTKQDTTGMIVIGGGGDVCTGCGVSNGHRAWPCAEVRDLAAIWADHPDYEQEWNT